MKFGQKNSLLYEVWETNDLFDYVWEKLIVNS